MQTKRKRFNICILGDTNIGKTWILNSYKGYINFDNFSIVGIESFLVNKTFDNLKFKFNIFDTAGKERYNSINSTAIKISDGYFIVFAVDNKSSFIKINNYINLIDNYLNLEEKVLYLVGNKIDIKPEKREVTKEEAEIFAKSKNFKYFEISALTKEGINEAFDEMFNDLYEKYKMNNEKETYENFEINKINEKKKTNFLFEIFNKNSKKKINYKHEADKQNNK